MLLVLVMLSLIGVLLALVWDMVGGSNLECRFQCRNQLHDPPFDPPAINVSCAGDEWGSGP